MQINKKQIAYNRSLRTADIRYIVIHDSGNAGKGANAESHFKYFNGGDRGSSADFFVDDTQSLQINDYMKYYTWHCGDGHGRYGITNNNSVGIEICINSDGDYNKAVQNAMELTRYLMSKLNIDINHVVRHYDASRKCCPMSMSGNGWAKWFEFKKRLTETEDEEVSKKEFERLVKSVNEIGARVTAQDKEIAELKKPEMIYNYIDDNMPEWAREAVQWCVDNRIVIGTGEGLGLDDTKLWLCVTLFRIARLMK